MGSRMAKAETPKSETREERLAAAMVERAQADRARDEADRKLRAIEEEQ